MEKTGKVLATGFLPATTGDIYSCPKFSRMGIKNISLVNTNTSTENVNLFFVPSGGSGVRIIPKNMTMSIAGQADEIGADIVLGYGDKLQGDAQTGSKVEYIIMGEDVS